MASTALSTEDRADTAAPRAAPRPWEEEEGPGQYFWGQGVDVIFSTVTGWPFLDGSSLNHIEIV